jgi:hypothetical protein
LTSSGERLSEKKPESPVTSVTRDCISSPLLRHILHGMWHFPGRTDEGGSPKASYEAQERALTEALEQFQGFMPPASYR